MYLVWDGVSFVVFILLASDVGWVSWICHVALLGGILCVYWLWIVFSFLLDKLARFATFARLLAVDCVFFCVFIFVGYVSWICHVAEGFSDCVGCRLVGLSVCAGCGLY